MKISDTGIALLKGVFVICALGAVVGLFFVADSLMYVGGVAIGGLISALKIILLERSVNRVLELDAKDAKSIMRKGSMSRYLLTGLALFLSIHFLGTSGFIGAIVGILSMQFSAFVAHFYIKNKC